MSARGTFADGVWTYDDESRMGGQMVKSRYVMKQVGKIRVVTNRLVDEHLSGEYHSVFKGQGIEFDEVREYITGDDIRAMGARTLEEGLGVGLEPDDLPESGRLGRVDPEALTQRGSVETQAPRFVSV